MNSKIDVAIINDITPRVNVDYGIITPLRPYGGHKVASSLNNKCINTVVLDFFFHFTKKERELTLESLIDSGLSIVGFSITSIRGHTRDGQQNSVDKIGDSLFYYWEIFRETIHWLRRKKPLIKILIGGAQISGLQKKSITWYANNIDFYITGESDNSVIALCQYILNKAPSPITSSQLVLSNGTYSLLNKRLRVIHSNIYYPVTKQEMWEMEPTTWKQNLSFLSENEYISVETARGCIFKCKFCAYTHNNKPKNPKTVAHEIQYLHDHYGIHNFRLMDDLFNDYVDKVNNYHTLFTSLNFDINWHSYARLDLISKYPDMAQKLFESGARYLKFGIESTSKEALRNCGKYFYSDEAKKTLKNIQNCTDGSLLTHSNFIIGLPGETVKSQQQTFKWLKESSLTTASFGVWFRDKFNDKESKFRTISEYGRDNVLTEKLKIKGYWGEWEHYTMNHKQAFDLEKEVAYWLKDPLPYWVGSDMYPIIRGLGVKHSDTHNYLKRAHNYTHFKSDRHLDNELVGGLKNIILNYKKKLFYHLGINSDPVFFIPPAKKYVDQ